MLPSSDSKSPRLDPVALALQRLMRSLLAVWQDCEHLADVVRMYPPVDAEQLWPEFLEQLAAMSKASKSLRQDAQRASCAWMAQSDDAALARMANTPERAAALRERIALANQRLKDLYPQLVALARQSATPLHQESLAPQPDRPLHDARLDVALSYDLDEADPCYDDNEDNILAEQKVLSWGTGGHAHLLFDDMEQHPWINDNWLDHRHPWMTDQCWLAHDLLEHNYGQNPLGGLAALLRVRYVHVDVHAVRSYRVDLQQGRFVAAPDDWPLMPRRPSKP